MLEIHQPPVVFKLLGTLRMLIDGQAELALKMLQNEKLIEQLVDWARKTPDMVGVNSESSRLMAWLVKHSYRSHDSSILSTAEPLKSFVRVDGSVDILVNMLLSVHLVMKNEALIAIALIVIFLSDMEVELSSILVASDIGQKLVDFIQRMSEMERTTNEILDNFNTLVKALQRFEKLKSHLDEHQIGEKLKSVPRIKELATL